MALKDWSTTAASNTTEFPEGMTAGSVNNGMRTVQADIRTWFQDPQWVNLGHTVTKQDSTNFKATGADYTSTTLGYTSYGVGRRVKMVGDTTVYDYITVETFNAVDTVVTVAAGTVPANLTDVWLGVIAPSTVGHSTSMPEGTIIYRGALQLATDGAVAGGTDTRLACTSASIAAKYGQAVTSTTGSSSVTLTGVTGIDTTTILYSLNGVANPICWVYIPEAVDTSDTAACSLATFPTAIHPGRNIDLVLRVKNNGTIGLQHCVMTTAGVLQLYSDLATTSGFTESGDKGLMASSFCYGLT
jgi:hypothetical protein